MIGNAANRLQNTFSITNHIADVGMEPLAPIGADWRCPILRAENDMIVKRWVDGIPVQFQRPCRGLSRLCQKPVAFATG